jgi:hypothetical protein
MWIETPAQLRSLASPVRQEIVDVLVSAGPASISDIAGYLGRPADGLYFHIRNLLRSGLLIERPPRIRGRHVAALYDVLGRPLRIRWLPERHPAVVRVMRGALRLAARELERSLGRPYASTDGPARTLWSGRSKGWVSPADLRRINALISKLTALLQRGKPGRGRTLQTFTFVSAPTPPNHRAPRRSQSIRSRTATPKPRKP